MILEQPNACAGSNSNIAVEVCYLLNRRAVVPLQTVNAIREDGPLLRREWSDRDLLIVTAR
jgi:hypothetical protein